MSEHSAFKRLHVEESAEEPVVGLLEQLGLPDGAITFIRRNLRTIWIITGSVAALVVAVSLYGSYSTYRDRNASTALTEAMQADAAQRPELLAKVIDEYDSTDSGLWARIGLGNVYLQEGKPEKAIEELLIVKAGVSDNNPVMPLLLFKVAALYEITGATDKAIVAYGQLAPYKGFDASASKAMGRLYEQQGNTEQALAMYQKYLADAEKEDGLSGADPDREMIKARVADLRN